MINMNETKTTYTIGERIDGYANVSRYATDATMYCEKCGQLSPVVLERGGEGYLAYDVTHSACCDASPYQDAERTELFDYDVLMGF